MAEYQSAFRPPPRNPSVVVAFWILGLVALFQIIVACLALAPKMVAQLRSSSAPLASSATTLPATPSTQAQLTQQKQTTAESAPSQPSSSLPLTQSPSDTAPSDSANQGINPADTTTQIPPADAAPQAGNILSIVSAKLEGGNDIGPKKLTIAMKAVPQESIDVPQVKVQVYFYDEEGGEVAPSKAQSVSKWLSSGTTWKNGEPELLEVRYLPDSTDPEVKFAGFVVAIYYKGDLQDYRAEPSRLTKLFPLKYYIGTDEQ